MAVADYFWASKKMKGGGGSFSKQVNTEISVNDLKPYVPYLLFPRKELNSYIPIPKTHIPSKDILQYNINTETRISKLENVLNTLPHHKKRDLQEEIAMLRGILDKIVPEYKKIALYENNKEDHLCFVDNKIITNAAGNSKYEKVSRYNGEDINCIKVSRLGTIWEDYEIFLADENGKILAGGRRKQTRKHRDKRKQKKTRRNRNRK